MKREINSYLEYTLKFYLRRKKNNTKNQIHNKRFLILITHELNSRGERSFGHLS